MSRVRVNKRSDIKRVRRTSKRTKAINRTIGNAQGGIRF